MSKRQGRRRVSPPPIDPPSLVDFQIGLARAVLHSNASHVEALRLFSAALNGSGKHSEALEVDRKIAGLAPNDPLAHYNLACDFSVLRRLDEAFEMLDRAFHLGYRDYRHLLSDADMKNVRRDPRFKKLLDRRWGKRRPS